jgi:hypothetical protein
MHGAPGNFPVVQGELSGIQCRFGPDFIFAPPSSTSASTAMAKKSDTLKHPITPDEIARRAYQIWQSEGCPDGRSTEHWLRAEAALRDGNSAPASAPVPDRKPAAGRTGKRFEMVS